MSVPPLPVAALSETCARYLEYVRPLLDDAVYAAAVRSTRYFEANTGRGLHAGLEQAAAASSTSWLIDAWLKSYLDVREPLPLAGNVGFAVQTRGYGLAEWVAALAGVCADYRHGRIETPQTPQGAPMCMEQWRILSGAARVPAEDTDTFRFADGSRHIGVMFKGYYYRIPALDEAGEAYHPDSFRRAFEAVLSDTAENPYPVCVPSYLGSTAAAEACRVLRQNPANAAMLDDMEQDLLHISIDGGTTDEGADTALARAAFQPHQAVWCFKPMTYCYDTATGRLVLHCEHTWQDGGTLKGIIARAAEKLGCSDGVQAVLEPVCRGWQLDDGQQKSWRQWRENYTARAAKMRVGSAVVPFTGKTVPKGISHDALMQFLLQYAQLATYGRVRNTYEAVDVSHFRSGRTECVRPVSEASLAFVGSLIREAPDRKLLDAALAEHKSRIKICKQGLAPNRQLLGLKLMVAEGRRMPAFFASTAYRVFSTDFLSTSTVGDDSVIVNFAFAPTSEGGLGVNYTLTADGWLFTVSHTVAQQQDVGIFLEALKEGGKILLETVGE